MNTNKIVKPMTRDEFITRTINKSMEHKIHTYNVIGEKLKHFNI